MAPWGRVTSALTPGAAAAPLAPPAHLYMHQEDGCPRPQLPAFRRVTWHLDLTRSLSQIHHRTLAWLLREGAEDSGGEEGGQVQEGGTSQSQTSDGHASKGPGRGTRTLGGGGV